MQFSKAFKSFFSSSMNQCDNTIKQLPSYKKV